MTRPPRDRAPVPARPGDPCHIRLTHPHRRDVIVAPATRHLTYDEALTYIDQLARRQAWGQIDREVRARIEQVGPDAILIDLIVPTDPPAAAALPAPVRRPALRLLPPVDVEPCPYDIEADDNGQLFLAC